MHFLFFFFSSRRRHTRLQGDWSSDVCSSDLSGCSRTRTTWSGGAAGSSSFRVMLDRLPNVAPAPLSFAWAAAGAATTRAAARASRGAFFIPRTSSELERELRLEQQL